MKVTPGHVTFRSDSPYYDMELRGVKPNTLRVVPKHMLAAVMDARTITIVSTDGCGEFTAPITSTVDVTRAMAKCGVEVPDTAALVVISWEVGK